MSSPLYQLKNVVRVFPMDKGQVVAVNHLSLEIFKGEWAALVGRSGSGKTTLLQLLGGLDKPTSGQIRLEERDLNKLSSSEMNLLRQNRIGFIFQSYHLFPELNALENASLPAWQWGMDRATAAKRAEKLLTAFGLKDRLNHRPRELSGGEQQRVAIARALINDPDIILADEPTGNLDAAASADIMNILHDVRNNNSKTLIMVTHDQKLAQQADRIITLGTAQK